MLLSSRQRRLLAAALSGRLLAVSFGSDVDSTAMLAALMLAGLRPAVITFADTGVEKPETLDHIDRMNAVLSDWSWPAVVVCRKIPLASTGYADLYGNCIGGWSEGR
jgi:3'-phosphoadenosine 5'-phosphosulfate sulfotransferase (PAPS reductase)/FAD synthetase